MQEYADPVIDWLDAGRGILARRLFRDVSVFLRCYPGPR
jgi:CTD nuclear envelope phosphatase 1